MARHSFFLSAPKQQLSAPSHQSSRPTSYQPYKPQPSHQIYQTYRPYPPSNQETLPIYQAYQPSPTPFHRPAHPAPGNTNAQSQNANSIPQVQYLPFIYQVSPLTPPSSTNSQPTASKPKIIAPPCPTKQPPHPPTRPAPPKPRLTRLIIPIRTSPPPVHIRLEPPRAPPPAPPVQIIAPAPRKPAVPARIPLAKKEGEDGDFELFQFQYPCMLPPDCVDISFGEAAELDSGETEKLDVVRVKQVELDGEEKEKAYSLPVLPGSGTSSNSSLRRSKDYLTGRRQRMSMRGGGRGIGSRTVSKEEEWVDEVVVDSAYDAVSMRPETPLEYRAEQAAALHALLGLVLEGKADVTVGEEVAVLEEEEEVELATRGFRKFSADEYVRELREVMGAFDSPC